VWADIDLISISTYAYLAFAVFVLEFLSFVVFMYDKYLENKSLFNAVFLILITVNKNNEVRVTFQLKLFEYLCIKKGLRPELPL